MAKYVCNMCGYTYIEELGDQTQNIEAGTKFDALPADWLCPICGVGKDEFTPQD